MRALAVALALLAGGAARAEGWDLMSGTTECAGLESLVVFGLIDGGEGGDTSELTAVVEADDPALCLEWLEHYGYPGLYNPTCVEVFDVLWDNGLPEWLAGQEPDYIAQLMAPFAPDTCDNMLIDLTAGE